MASELALKHDSRLPVTLEKNLLALAEARRKHRMPAELCAEITSQIDELDAAAITYADREIADAAELSNNVYLGQGLFGPRIIRHDDLRVLATPV